MLDWRRWFWALKWSKICLNILTSWLTQVVISTWWQRCRNISQYWVSKDIYIQSYFLKSTRCETHDTIQFKRVMILQLIFVIINRTRKSRYERITYTEAYIHIQKLTLIKHCLYITLLYPIFIVLEENSKSSDSTEVSMILKNPLLISDI